MSVDEYKMDLAEKLDCFLELKTASDWERIE